MVLHCGVGASKSVAYALLGGAVMDFFPINGRTLRVAATIRSLEIRLRASLFIASNTLLIV